MGVFPSSRAVVFLFFPKGLYTPLLGCVGRVDVRDTPSLIMAFFSNGCSLVFSFIFCLLYPSFPWLNLREWWKDSFLFGKGLRYVLAPKSPLRLILFNPISTYFCQVDRFSPNTAWPIFALFLPVLLTSVLDYGWPFEYPLIPLRLHAFYQFKLCVCIVRAIFHR